MSFSLILFLLIMVSFISPVFGHASPILYNPAANQVFNSTDAVPDQLSITFTERPEPRASNIQVFDENNVRVDNDDLTITGDEKIASVTIDKAKTQPGVYTVNWLVLSKDDGHITKGSYVFSIDENQQQSLTDSNGTTGFSEVANADSLQIQLDIHPLQIGENNFNVTVADNQGNPVDTIRNVYLELNNPSKGLEPISTTLENRALGEYNTKGSFLSQSGKWEIEVTIQRTDAYDIKHIFNVEVE